MSSTMKQSSTGFHVSFGFNLVYYGSDGISRTHLRRKCVLDKWLSNYFAVSRNMARFLYDIEKIKVM